MVRKLSGYFLILWGLLLAVGLLNSKKEFDPLGDIMAFVLLGLLPAIFGLYMIIKEKKKRQKGREEFIEKEILLLAKMKGSRITIPDVASHTSISLDEAKKKLDEFAQKGYADYEVDETGTILYKFFLSHEK